MAFDESDDDERLPADGPLPPEDRNWRHPSEVASGVPLPAAWLPPPAPTPRRSMLLAALVSSCVAGAVIGMAVMWVARPTQEAEDRATTTRPLGIATASFSSPTAASELAERYRPSLAALDVEHAGTWSTGTAIWLDDAGTLVVASPLVDGASSVMVHAPDGTRSAALAMASDDMTGITVLKAAETTGSPLDAATTSVRSGQAVMAIGATRDDARVLSASVSAVDVRSTIEPMVLHEALQLDGSVPADAVGSLVVDPDGGLVGIVVAPTLEGDLAVAVPLDQALTAAHELRDHGEVERPWLGVRATDLAPDDAERLGVQGGALLTEVQGASPAASAELAPGDAITDLDGDAIADASDLVVALGRHDPGDEVELTWYPEGSDRPTTATVRLGG